MSAVGMGLPVLPTVRLNWLKEMVGASQPTQGGFMQVLASTITPLSILG